MKNTTTSWLDF